MSTIEQLSQGVIVMISLIVLVIILKYLGVLKKDNSLITSNLVLKVTLPAIIFLSLASQTFSYNLIIIAGIVAIAEIISLLLAWIAAKLVGLNRGETGALMLVSAFGMSTMLGYPLIQQTFPGNIIAMEDAVITSEIGVGVLLFIIGPIVAMHYGDNQFNSNTILPSIKKFIKSPIFISIIAGIGISFVSFPKDNFAVETTTHLLKQVGNANLLLVAITIGLLLELNHLKGMTVFLLIAVSLKLICQPLMTHQLLTWLNIDMVAKQVATIETSMPSAILVAIYTRQYNCKPELVSGTILVTLIISLISVTGLFYILF